MYFTQLMLLRSGITGKNIARPERRCTGVKIGRHDPASSKITGTVYASDAVRRSP